MPAIDWELASQIMTSFGFPLAVFVFLYDRRQERLSGEDEVYEQLSDNYQDFLHTVLENPDLHLSVPESTADLSPEQEERMFVIFSMLISLFERAYLLLYGSRLSRKQARRWASWADYMEEWCRRDDFARNLPVLLKGEDPEFASYIGDLCARVRRPGGSGGSGCP
jgi:hypothetical protein